MIQLWGAAINEDAASKSERARMRHCNYFSGMDCLLEAFAVPAEHPGLGDLVRAEEAQGEAVDVAVAGSLPVGRRRRTRIRLRF
jgi:hypothetical protein